MEKQKLLENVWIRALSILCVLALFFTLCYFLKGILISFFLAFTVAYIFDPVVDFISERKVVFAKTRIPRGLSVAILLVSVFLVMGGLLTYTVPKTVSGIQRVGTALKEQYPKYQEKVENIIEEYGDTEVGIFLKSKLQIQTTDETEIKDEKSQEQEAKEVTTKESVDVKYGIPDPVLKMKKYVPVAMNFVLGIMKNVFYSTFGFFGIVMNVVVFGVVMVYLLKDFDLAMSKGEELLPASKKEKISGIISKIDGNLKAFFRGQMAVCAILSIIYGIGLTVIGIPMSFLLALVGGFGNMIPYVGIGLGLIPAIILAFIQFQDFTHVLLVVLVFGIGQFLEGTVITPKIVGDKLGLHPVAIILAILICGQILGFLGLLLAVPIASVVKVLFDEGILRYKNTKLYKGD